MERPLDTIAALATPAGTSALAVIRITGSDTTRVASDILGPLPPPRAATRGDYRDRAGTVLDDALFTLFPAPRSYTGEDLLEISCHGNPYIAQRILEDLHARGCRPAEPGEFTRRAFLNGRLDLSQAEAVMDVISARGDLALAAAQRQLRGAFGRHLESLSGSLLAALARVEAQIDFPEEDIPAEDRAALRAAVEPLLRATAGLLATRRHGELLRDGVKTVIVGEPNAGKSSLLNRLVGSERAIVSPEPGTTRDFIEERIIAGPHCLRLIDTAGLNPSPGEVERLGISRTEDRIQDSDIIILVLDAGRPSPPLPAHLAARLLPGTAVVALNKTDLLRGPPLASAPAGLPAIPVSALTGDGIPALMAAVTSLADGFTRTAGEDGIVINARHSRSLLQAQECLTDALDKLDSGAPLELLASDLRGALGAFGEISGKIDNEQMLDRLFAEFCIGK